MEWWDTDAASEARRLQYFTVKELLFIACQAARRNASQATNVAQSQLLQMGDCENQAAAMESADDPHAAAWSQDRGASQVEMLQANKRLGWVAGSDIDLLYEQQLQLDWMRETMGGYSRRGLPLKTPLELLRFRRRERFGTLACPPLCPRPFCCPLRPCNSFLHLKTPPSSSFLPLSHSSSFLCVCISSGYVERR